MHLRHGSGVDLPIGDELLLGRDVLTQANLSEDEKASRQHARIRRDEKGQFVIEDLNSTNGTYVNGERVSSPRVLRSGDEVRIGSTSLTVVDPRATSAEPTSRPTSAESPSRPTRAA
ncbi:MAG: FHA domain-containing protein, partial [Actinomycetota bacterium]